MVSKTLLLSIFLIAAATIKAQSETEISGHAPDLAGQRVNLFGFADHISKMAVLLDSAEVDAEGEFLLSFESDEIRYVQVASSFRAANLYTQPSTWYDIEFPTPNADQPKAFGRKSKTEVIFNNLELDDINALIIDFNYNYEVFFQSNYEVLQKLFSPRNYKALNDSTPTKPSGQSGLKKLFLDTKTFSSQMDSMYADWDSPYFTQYRASVLGDLMMNSPASPREIFDSYIDPFPINGQHVESCRLHERFFKFYFTRYAQSYGNEDLDFVLNEKGDYQGLRELLTKDDFLSDPERMDFLISLAIQEVWKSNALDQKSMAKILESIVANGATGQSRSMANTMHKKLTACKKGFAPLNIEFEDEYKDRKRISDYKGAPLLIEFWAQWCSNCTSEKAHLSEMIEEYKGDIQILSVEVLENGLSPQIAQEQEVYSRTHAFMDSHWLRAYEVLSLPHYILIDADGLVMRDHTPLPSQGLEAILFKIRADQKKDRKRKVGDRNN